MILKGWKLPQLKASSWGPMCLGWTGKLFFRGWVGEGQSQKSTGRGDFPVVFIIFAGQAGNSSLPIVRGRFPAGQGAHPFLMPMC